MSDRWCTPAAAESACSRAHALSVKRDLVICQKRPIEIERASPALLEREHVAGDAEEIFEARDKAYRVYRVYNIYYTEEIFTIQRKYSITIQRKYSRHMAKQIEEICQA